VSSNRKEGLKMKRLWVSIRALSFILSVDGIARDGFTRGRGLCGSCFEKSPLLLWENGPGRVGSGVEERLPFS
jgi:hypothetical protein